MTFASEPGRDASVFAKRMLDVILASVALALAGPIMILVALAIVIESGRPILFSQTRLGRNGRPFRLYKFRKFHKDTGAAGLSVTIENDSRMTLVGGFLEKTKFDELPQLWNVLTDDMSIVGPRPESLAFEDCFKGEYSKVLDFKPGILGPNQFFFRNEKCFYRDAPDPERFYRDVLFPLKAGIDLAYFSHRTLPSDLGWVISCALAMVGLSPLPSKMLKILIEKSPAKNPDQAATGF